MAPSVPVLDVYQVVTRGTLNGMPCDHVINWHLPGLASSATGNCEQFATADKFGWMPNLGNKLPPFYTHVNTTCTYLGNTTTPVSDIPVGTIGGSTLTFASHASAVTIRHHVPVRGRGRQGRTNFPGPASEDIQQPQGQLKTGVQADYTMFFQNYLAEIKSFMNTAVSITPDIVILSRKTGTYIVPIQSECDFLPSTHRRWQKRLARH